MIVIQLLRQIFQDGGWVIWPIMGVSILGLYLGFGKIVQLYTITRARKKFFILLRTPVKAAGSSTGFAPYNLLLQNLLSLSETQKHYARQYAQEFIIQVMPQLDRELSTMSTCVSVAPLLGLLGTITGMNRMFDIINEFGLGSPSLMAEGISIALQATLTGLTVAVAVMFLHNYLLNRKESLAGKMLKDAEELAKANFVQPPDLEMTNNG